MSKITMLYKVFVPLFLICHVVATQGWSAGQQKEKDKNKSYSIPHGVPEIRFDELFHDFGKAFQNSTLKHTFTFENVGRGVLHIEKVKAG